MKVCAFVGSPRKSGNSDVMADAFLEGARSAGAETQKYFLADCDINQCQGCFRSCIVNPGMRCAVFRDDMDMLLDEMVSSDVVFFTSPLYCAGYSSIMARFFERCLPLWEVELTGQPGTPQAFNFKHVPTKDKKAAVGLVQDFKDKSVGIQAIEAFEHNITKIYMMNLIDIIHVGDVRDVGDLKKKQDELDHIRNRGRAAIDG